MTFPIHALTPENFPSPLWQVAQPPLFLYARCATQSLELLRHLPEQGLAIVGTRYPQNRSIHHLNRTIHDLRDSKLIIVSGFAIGIDTAAHEAALEAGLPTVAVLGGGLNHIYPEENLALEEQLLRAGGILISEFAPDEKAVGANFLRRNRLIAGWSKATWVVEASYRSGSLNTARWAREQHVTTFATPCFPGDTTLAGNQILLDEHHATALWNAQSLGQVWLDLATVDVKSDHKSKTPKNQARTDEQLLESKVAQLTLEKSGADVHELLNWAMTESWLPARFFSVLQSSLEKGHLLDSNGLLLKNTTH